MSDGFNPFIQEPEDGIFCFDRDITSQLVVARTTCFMHDPKITGTITIQGDGTILVF